MFEPSTYSVSCTPSPSEFKNISQRQGSVVPIFYPSKLMQRGEV